MTAQSQVSLAGQALSRKYTPINPATRERSGLGPSFATGLAKVLSSLPGGHRRVAEHEAARTLVVDDGYLRG